MLPLKEMLCIIAVSWLVPIWKLSYKIILPVLDKMYPGYVYPGMRVVEFDAPACYNTLVSLLKQLTEEYGGSILYR